MNLDSAKNAVEFCKVTEKDESGRPQTVLCPGHEMRRYVVDINRHDGKSGIISVQCFSEDSEEPCAGNSHGKVCYHCLAALMKSVEGIGHLEFFESRETPLMLVEMGRKMFKVASANGTGVLYAVFFQYRKKKRKVPVVQRVIVPQGMGPYDPAIRA
jgi:hypothetical protein